MCHRKVFKSFFSCGRHICTLDSKWAPCGERDKTNRLCDVIGPSEVTEAEEHHDTECSYCKRWTGSPQMSSHRQLGTY